MMDLIIRLTRPKNCNGWHADFKKGWMVMTLIALLMSYLKRKSAHLIHLAVHFLYKKLHQKSLRSGI